MTRRTETRVQYAPSTKFYLQDKRDGKPWVTRLPFPVHVVERVKTSLPQTQCTLVSKFSGWMPSFMTSSSAACIAPEWDGGPGPV